MIRSASVTWAGGGSTIGVSQLYYGGNSAVYGTGSTLGGGVETRPINTAFAPRIHV